MRVGKKSNEGILFKPHNDKVFGVEVAVPFNISDKDVFSGVGIGEIPVVINQTTWVSLVSRL